MPPFCETARYRQVNFCTSTEKLSRKRGKSTEIYAIYFPDNAGKNSPEICATHFSYDAGKYSPEIYATHFPDDAGKNSPEICATHFPDDAGKDSPEIYATHFPDDAGKNSPEIYATHFSDDAGKNSPEIYATHFPDDAEKTHPKIRIIFPKNKTPLVAYLRHAIFFAGHFHSTKRQSLTGLKFHRLNGISFQIFKMRNSLFNRQTDRPPQKFTCR